MNASKLAEAKALLAEMAKEAAELKAAAGGSITDAVADWLSPQYLMAAREKLTASDGARRWEVFRAIVHDWTTLRRGDHAAARLQLDREELDWQRANAESEKQKEFREWLQRPEIRKEYFPERTGGISEATLKKIEEELRLL